MKWHSVSVQNSDSTIIAMVLRQYMSTLDADVSSVLNIEEWECVALVRPRFFHPPFAIVA